MAKTGYRCGDIGSYTGGDVSEAEIAWKALNYEYEELGNDHLLEEVAEFLGIKPVSWKVVIAAFKRQYPNTRGIWLSRNKKDAQQYREYGDPKPYSYEEKDVVSDLGGDGIFVLDQTKTALPPKTYEYIQREGSWLHMCKACGHPLRFNEISIEVEKSGGSDYYHPEHYNKGQSVKKGTRKARNRVYKSNGRSPTTLGGLR